MSNTENQKKATQMNEQQETVLANINQLQDMEKDVYKKLEIDAASEVPDVEKQQDYIKEINNLSKMRSDLYTQLGTMYNSLTNNVVSGRNNLVNQIAMTKITEQELNRTKDSLNQIEDPKNNQLKMVQINTYEAKRLNANKKVMQGVVIVCLCLVVLTFLYNKNIIGGNFAKILFVVIILGGFGYLGYQIMDIYKRDNMNFDEYEFSFNAAATKAALDSANANKNANAGVCMNGSCCSDGTTFSTEKHQCVPDTLPAGTGATPTTSGSPSVGAAEGFTTTGQQNMNNVTKQKKEGKNFTNLFGLLTAYSSNKEVVETEYPKQKVACYNNENDSYASY